MGWPRQAKDIYSGRVFEDHGSDVGLLLSPAAARALVSYQCISDRLLTARINCGIIRTTIAVCYAPTDGDLHRLEH